MFNQKTTRTPMLFNTAKIVAELKKPFMDHMVHGIEPLTTETDVHFYSEIPVSDLTFEQYLEGLKALALPDTAVVEACDDDYILVKAHVRYDPETRSIIYPSPESIGISRAMMAIELREIAKRTINFIGTLEQRAQFQEFMKNMLRINYEK